MIKSDFEEIKEDIQRNRKDRLWFVDLWADFVRTHTDQEWSKQQNVLINSMFDNSKNFPLTKEQYLEIKAKSKAA